MLVAAPDGGISRDPLGDLKKMARATLDTVLDAEFVQLYRIIIAEALPFPELACAAADNWGSSFADQCIDAVRQAQAQGLCKPGDPETLAKCFLWSVTGEALLKGLTGMADPMSPAERDAHLETAWQVFMDGVVIRV
jgi:AcrR family transcriptional regulator